MHVVCSVPRALRWKSNYEQERLCFIDGRQTGNHPQLLGWNLMLPGIVREPQKTNKQEALGRCLRETSQCSFI